MQSITPSASWVRYFVGLQVLLIIALGVSIYQKLHGPRVLGAYTTPVHKEHLSMTVIDNERTLWEHSGGEIDESTVSWLPYTVTYRINNDGMNSAHDYETIKPDRTIRIMALGDSFTFGAWVNTNENYPSVLEQSLNAHAQSGIHYEVLNLGEVGYDIDFMAERYYRRGKKYNPDIIVMLLPECDFTEISGFMDSQVNKQDIRLRSTMTDTIKRQMAAIAIAHDDITQMTDDKIELFEFDRLSEFVEFVKKPVILLTDDKTSAHGLSLLKYFAALHSGVYFSQLSSFDRLPDMHPSVLGHKEIADSIRTILISHQLID